MQDTLHIVLNSYLHTFANLLDKMNEEHKEKCQDIKDKILSVFPNIGVSDNPLQIKQLKEENEKLKIENDKLKKEIGIERKQKVPKIVKHEMTVKLCHTQDWSYGIKFDFFKNRSINAEGRGSPGVIKGSFPKNKINCIIGDVEIISQKNKLGGKECGMARSLNIDTKSGIIWTESPYGHRYGANVTWETEITFVITYLDF